LRASDYWRSQDEQFWAYVRVLSEKRGYAKRGADSIAVYSLDECKATLRELDRDPTVLDDGDLGPRLVEYFAYRAYELNEVARNNLMTAEEASLLYEQIVEENCVAVTDLYDRKGVLVAAEYEVRGGVNVRVPMNKQKGVKRAPSYLTGMVNILFSRELQGKSFEDDPRRLPVVDRDGELFGAMSRRLDGAYPSSVNPRALWEIKEYYYTTTFGSKVSDAVYISQLDGHERHEIVEATSLPIDLYLFVDAKGTWWDKGKAYLCRLVDAVNKGVVDEIVVGRECVEAIPRLVRSW
jgi:hypothetical protein